MTDGVGTDDRRSQRQRMLDGNLYIADDPGLPADALRAMRLQDSSTGPSPTRGARAAES